MSVLVEFRNVDLSYGAHNVLDGVNMRISSGEIVTIVGPNGSGKSSLLRALIGALVPSSGTITQASGLRIGYVPQKLHIDPTLPMTVTRFLSLPHRVPNSQAADALTHAGVPELGRQQMSSLSGGQLQRVLLARALLHRPQLLLLDEATQGLDQPGSAAFYQHIEQVRNDLNCAVLMISHELHVVMSASDRVICLNGHVCCEGKPEAVASAPEYRALFGSGTGGALALYRHDHDHDHVHGHGEDCDHNHSHEAAQ
ncbi:ATP-binding cassette domain-containing protein [uncultured Litoreibacter sp.]|uniref:ATP-binding cassette domain-containing protein n=1 Tax=uncultured Litoreibacter sp. TaxID=1392394 RepID=UPI002624C97F|nr:ATP-binding cassette domain-containing protein [uncultured Litoreibacter sp.]